MKKVEPGQRWICCYGEDFGLNIVVEVIDEEAYRDGFLLKTIQYLEKNKIRNNPLGEQWVSEYIIDQSIFNWTYLPGQNNPLL